MINILRLTLIPLFLAAVTLLSGCSGGDRPQDDIAPVSLATVPAATAATPQVQTDQSSPTVAVSAAEATVTGSPVISFTLSGGLIGFCDELSITADGVYLLRSCQQEESKGTLAKGDLDSLTAWGKDLAGFSLKTGESPAPADGLASTLVFNGRGSTPADEAQQKLISDWANGLLMRLRPQPVPSPTPAPIVVGEGGFCPDIKRPAVLVIDFNLPGGLALVDPVSKTNCTIQLKQPPYGNVAAAAGSIFYPLYDETAKTVTLWQLTPNGEQKSLDFTKVDMPEFGPYNFVVSSDGKKIAWTRAVVNLEADPPLYRNDLWVANSDGSNQTQLLTQAEYEQRYVQPVRFSADQNTLYYAQQPDGLGGSLFSFGGRYDSLYSLPVSGGEPHLIFACPTGEQANPICIGDITPDGSALAYVEPGTGIIVLGGDGQTLNTLTPPNSGFVGSPVFGPTGNLAFVSANLTEGSEQELPRPNPGTISMVAPPYTGEAKTLLNDNSVTSVWEWLDENRLIFGVLDQEGNLGTAMLGVMDGQRVDLSPNFAVAVLR